MKTLKLEVGKTYRSREGEEVKIVGNGGGKYPCQGDNGYWYTESGRWEGTGVEGPDDLIEEVPEPIRHTFGLVPETLTSIRHSFDVPDGVKEVTVEQVGNRIVVEMVPEERKEPKPGDVMINRFGSVYIFKEGDGDKHNFYAWLGESGRLSISGALCEPGRPATPEEAQPLFDALKKAGKRWNPEAMQVEDVPESERIMSFLQGYEENTTWNHGQLCWLIESYLKYREGEK